MPPTGRSTRKYTRRRTPSSTPIKTYYTVQHNAKGEYYIGTTPPSGTPWNDSWPSVDWADLRKVIEAVPESPRNLYVIMFIGRLYRHGDKVSGFSGIRDIQELIRLYDVYPRTRWHHMTFEQEVEDFFDMVEGTPEKIIGWVAKAVGA